MKRSEKWEGIDTVSEVELIYHSKVKPADRPQVHSSKEAYEVLMKCWDYDKIELQEEFKVLFLNRVGRVLGIYNLSSGGINGTVADPKLIFAAALKAAASTIIIAHNHPTGSLRPSKGDEALTEKIKAGGELLDIKLNDHLVVSQYGYYSFADEGVF